MGRGDRSTDGGGGSVGPPATVPSVADDEAAAERDVLIPYLLRVVRIGVVSTFAVLVPLALYPLLGPRMPVSRPGLYALALVLALLAAGGVAALPWSRLLATRRPMAAFYLWSVGDIALISVLVGATHGIDSPLWSVYTLTTLFFAATYPRGGQVAMLACTALGYVAAVGLASPPLAAHAGDLAVRLGILAVLAMMAGFISAELTRLMATQARRAHASRRVARAGPQIATLQRDAVFETAVEATAELGFPVCVAVMLEGSAYTVMASHGLPDDFDRVRLTLGGRIPGTGTQAWVMPAAEIDDPAIRELVRAADAAAVIAAPLVVASERVGLLAAVGDDDPIHLEAVQTLATLTSNALENAELYRLKDDFVANVSHELRTPLTLLSGLGETLSRRSHELPREQIRDLAGRVEANAGRLEAMISTLLDFSRLQARRRHSNHTEVDLSTLAHETVGRVEERLRPREVGVDAAPGCVVVADRIMLEQVLENLLANVATHTPPDTTARLTVRRSGDEIEVVLVDDGPGIAPEDARRATERFFRGGDHLTRDSRGLGLGLALVRELLALHGSDLGLSRPQEGGTRIVFRLPAVSSAVPSRPADRAQRS